MTRILRKKNYSMICLLSGFVLFSFIACDKPSISFGTTFINNNNTNIIVVDTFTTALSTVRLDSFPTNSTGVMLIGSYNDPYFGTITSKAVLQFGVPSIPVLTTQSVFDSISLIMRINKTFYGDTTIPQRYYVSQLDTPLRLPLPPLPQAFFNNKVVGFNTNPLGFTDVTIKPTALITKSIYSKDSVQIELPDTLGKDLMHLMYTKSEIVTNLTAFLNYFKGLYIYSDTVAGKGVIFGFNDSAIIRLVYHDPGAVFTYHNVYFQINNRAYQFNQVNTDRSATPLTALNSAPRPNPNVWTEVPSSQTNHNAYLQSGTGLQIKIRFPTISTLSQFSDYLGIYKAELILKPVSGSYNPLLPLPPQLILSQTNENNQLGSVLTYGGTVQYGNLVTDYITGQNTGYVYDVTSFIKQQVGLPASSLNGLMLSIPSPSNYTTMNRVVIGDQTNKVFNASLKVYYVSLPH
ncbi:MAG: DUF4270 family protein [Bacteroidetes bacterium]|nr:DUF4270 family protein [Bacteroidota bacterium]